MNAQEELTKKEIKIAFRVVGKGLEVGWKLLMKAFDKVKEKYSDIEETLLGQKDYNGVGKQSVKNLIGQGRGEVTAEIEGNGKRHFEKIARQYGVDYAIKRTGNDEKGNNTFTVFLKANSKESLESMMKEFSSKMEKIEANKAKGVREKPSLIQRLDKYKEKAKSQAMEQARENKDKFKEKVMER